MIREIADDEVQLAADTLLHLRGHHGTAEAVAGAIVRQRAGGYRLLGSVGSDGGVMAAVAGFRVVENLAVGTFLYVDDLVTHPDHRRAGHATALLDALDDLAVREGCVALHLDSGVGDDRRDAHRRYFGHGMRISSFHFVKSPR